MGGGKRRVPETPKRLPLRSGSGAGQVDLEIDVCERSQLVAFLVAGEIKVGERATVTLADPPILMRNGAVIGRVSDRRQAATLTACLEAGFALVCEVLAVDRELDEGLAAVSGSR